MMRKLLLQGAVFSLLALGFVSCDSDDNNGTWTDPEVTTTGIYILNNGNWGANDAKLSYYNVDTKTVTADVFYNMNGEQKLGDLAQDMTVYGSRMYITVTGSNKIFITDRSAKILRTIDPKNGDKPMEPRYTKTYNGKVYVTTQSGYVLRIDTTSMAVDKQIKVGSYPEQMTIVNNNLYVANSGQGADNTVSVVNLSTYTETKIPVIINPEKITSDRYGNIYVISTGDYGDIRPTLQKINPDTKAVSVIGTDIATRMAASGDKLFLIYMDPTDYSATVAAKLYYYDIAKGEVVKQSFVMPPSATDLDKASVISIDPGNSDIYISTTDSVTKGSVYKFSSSGQYQTKFSSEGLNPMGAFFLTETK
jgi:YVTN family beta-propeller protein